MIYIKVRDKWYTTNSSVQSSGELSRFTYDKCQIIFDDETSQLEIQAHFDTATGNWSNTFLDISTEQIKLEIFLQKEDFVEWNEVLDANWPYWDNYNA